LRIVVVIMSHWSPNVYHRPISIFYLRPHVPIHGNRYHLWPRGIRYRLLPRTYFSTTWGRRSLSDCLRHRQYNNELYDKRIVCWLFSIHRIIIIACYLFFWIWHITLRFESCKKYMILYFDSLVFYLNY